VGPAGGFHRTSSPPSFDPSSTQTRRPGADSADRVELSEHARYMNQLREMASQRSEKIDIIRKQIAAGTYETDRKLDVAVSRLIDSFIR